MKMKKLLALFMALAMVMSLAACGGSSSTSDGDSTETTATESTAAESTSAETEAATEGSEDEYKVFKYGTDANSTTFDPAADLQTNSGSFLVHAVGESLWTVNEDGSVNYKIAESMEYDETQLVLHIRPGVLFSNGDECTGEDVIFTLENCAAQPRTASMYASMDIENAEISDDGLTVTIPMNYYDAALVDLLGNANNCVLDHNVFDAENADWLIGTGPYMLKGDGITDKSGWEESVSYTLVRNPNYWGDEPYYDEFDVYFYSEESTRYADFQAGKLDAIYLTEATYINNLGSGAVSGASLVTAVEPSVYGFEMAWNSDSMGTFADINVRKAFAHCLDINAMVEQLGEGVYTVASSLVGENSWAYVDTGVYDYDPEAAASYLAEAGYSVDNPITIKVYAEGTAWNSAMFEAAQAYCSAIGINLDLSGVADFATILPVLISGEQDMSLGQGSNGSGSDPANLLQQFGPASDNVLIRTCATDFPELAQLFTDAAACQDQNERAQMYQDFIQGIYDNYLFVPICQGSKNFGVLDQHSSLANSIDSANVVDPCLLTD
jgi:peptide/nickel transport system substrate-binding protein